MARKKENKWILDHVADTMLSLGLFNPKRVLDKKAFYESQGYETKLKRDFPRKGIMKLFYREK